MSLADTRRGFLATLATLGATFGQMRRVAAAGMGASGPADAPRRVSLPKPGPMLPPVPAILLTVKGRPGEPDEVSVLWTFVVNGDPPQVGVSAGDEHRAGPLVALHREFVLNVPVASLVESFDRVDMSSSKVADKFARSGLTRGRATVVDAPTVEEAPIQVECRVSHVLRVPPARTVYIADVVATTVHPGVCDDAGRLRVSAVEFFGMTAGSGEFYTMGRSVGHIGQTVGRKDIRY
jgi:flavin reductase (DIM6/NTAB) family NADH-FMN oxidoreductase RutF